MLIRRGVLKRTGRDIALQRINDVGFSQSLWDRMVNAGTLTIESAGEQGQEVLENMPRSDEMQQKLNRLIEADGDRRAQRAYGGANPQQGPGPVPARATARRAARRRTRSRAASTRPPSSTRSSRALINCGFWSHSTRIRS